MSKWSFSIPTLNTHPIARFRWRMLRSELAALLRLWGERSCERRHLAEIAKWDDYVLKDIGVSRQQALGEATVTIFERSVHGPFESITIRQGGQTEHD